MKVKELIKQLQKENQNRIVVMYKDSEGNSYSPLSGLWTGAYKADSIYSGEVGIEQLTPRDIKNGYTAADILDGVPAVILMPTN
jgi:hypothetical protein